MEFTLVWTCAEMELTRTQKLSREGKYIVVQMTFVYTLIYLQRCIYESRLKSTLHLACICEVASCDSLLCKPSSNWSPSVRSCFYRVSDNPTSCKICADKLFLHWVLRKCIVNCVPALQPKMKLKSRYDWWSVSQYGLVTSPLWDLWPDINFVWNLLSCLCRAPWLMRSPVNLLSVTVSGNCPSSSFFFLFPSVFHVTRFIHIQYVQGLVSPGSVQQIMLLHLWLTLQQQPKHLNGCTLDRHQV
jgi:hypothetical protein